MKLSHILIKVTDLDSAVYEWQKKGFTVEYGRAKKPYNALIYFKEGPYIELFKFNGFPKPIAFILALLGKKKLVEKMNFWAKHEDGLLSIMLENYEQNLSKEVEILKKHGYFGTLSKKSRIDTKNRKLNFTVMFTDDIHFPDLMTYFSTAPKPQNQKRIYILTI